MGEKTDALTVIKEGLIEVKQPLICVPIVAKDRRDLLEQAAEAAGYDPDLIEWRSDSFEWSESKMEVSRVLEELKYITGKTPLVFTCRSAQEGGMNDISEALRIRILIQAIETGLIDIVDIELVTGYAVINQLKDLAERLGTKLILSCHDFDGTPEEDLILNKMEEAQRLGAHIAKVAVMPNNQGDVLRLLSAVYRAKSGRVRIPIAAMAMGQLGVITRMAAGYFGSDIVYASGRVGSAPGQMPIEELKSLWRHLYNNCGRRDFDDNSDDCPCK